MKKNLVKMIRMAVVGGLIIGVNSLVGCSTAVKNEVVNNINSNEELNERISNAINHTIATEEGFIVPEKSAIKLVYTQNEYNNNMIAWLNFKNIGETKLKFTIYGTINNEDFKAEGTVLNPQEQENIRIAFNGANLGEALAYKTEEIKINKIVVREWINNEGEDYPINIDLVINKNDTKVKILNEKQFYEDNSSIRRVDIDYHAATREAEKRATARREAEKRATAKKEASKEENKTKTDNKDNQEAVKETMPVFINNIDASYHRVGGCNKVNKHSEDYTKVSKDVAEKYGKKACPICCGSNY